MPLLINNEQSQPLPAVWQEKINDLLPRYYEQVAIDEAAVIGVTFVDDDDIQDINRTHRGIDRPTDVLSFPMFEPDEEIVAMPGEELLLGDIVISLPRAQAQSDAYGHSLDREVLFLLVHGLMHLAGYDHELEEDRADMRAAEETLLAAIGMERR